MRHKHRSRVHRYMSQSM